MRNYSLFFLFVFAVYLYFIGSNIMLIDGVEFSLASWCLGIPHPSSYPLFLLISRLFSFVPAGNVAYRANIASSFIAALCVVFLFHLIQKLTFSISAAFLASLNFAFGYENFAQAISAEVYSLHLLIMVAMLIILFADLKANPSQQNRRIFLAAFFLGLSLANHHQILLAIPFIFLYALIRYYKVIISRRFFLAGLFFLLGISPYLYLPLRSINNPPIDRSNPENYKPFIEVIFKRASASYQDIKINTLLNFKIHFRRLMANFSRQSSLIFPALAILGAAFFIRRFPIEGLTLFSIAVFTSFITMFAFYSRTYDIAYMIDPFFLPLYLFMAIFSGYGLRVLFKEIYFIKSSIGFQKVIFLLILGLISLFFIFNLPYIKALDNFAAYGWAKNVLNNSKRNSIIIAGVDEYFPIVYAQIVEHYRADIDAYHLIAIERDPQGWFLDANQPPKVRYPVQKGAPREVYTLAEKIKSGLECALQNIHRPIALVHFSRDIIPDGYRTYLEGLNYYFIPKDIPLIEDLNYSLAIWNRMDLRGVLIEDQKETAFRDEATKQLVSTYAVASNNLAGLFLLVGNKDKARSLFQQTLKIDPNNEIAKSLLPKCK